MASTSERQSYLEAENRHLKKQLEVEKQMYDDLLDAFKKIKTHTSILEEYIESMKKANYNANQDLALASPEPSENARTPNLTDRYYSCCTLGSGPIVFGNCDVGGEFLELKNISHKAVDIGYFVIKRMIDGLSFEVDLPKYTKIKADSKLVLRAKSQNSSETPALNHHTLFLDNVAHWLSGELIHTVLLDSRGTEVASIVQGMEKKVEEI